MVPKEISELRSAEQLSKQVFINLHRVIISHGEGANLGDVEAIHDMRVAIRRFRVALNNFAVCILREDRQRLRTRLEHLADALGGVRDLDVMIEALILARSNRTEAERRSLATIIRRLRSRRRSRLQKLSSYLKGDEYAAFKREFSDAPEPIQQEGQHGQAA